MKRRLVLCLATFALLTACDTTNASSGTTTLPPSSTTSSTAAPTTAAATSTGITEASVPPTYPKRYLTNVSATHIDGHDQLAFTFNDGIPGYIAEYIKPPLTSDGEGAPVTLSGDSVIKMVFASAGTIELAENGKTYYSGPRTIQPMNTTVISEIKIATEFEGRLLIGVGTKSKTNFAVASNGNTLTFTFNS